MESAVVRRQSPTLRYTLVSLFPTPSQLSRSYPLLYLTTRRVLSSLNIPRAHKNHRILSLELGCAYAAPGMILHQFST